MTAPAPPTGRPALRTRAAVAAGRAVGALSRATGRGQGATISGRVINALAPHALAELGSSHRVGLVSATNGKTTTTRLLVAALARGGGLPVASNSTGANLTSGIAPALAAAPPGSIAILEADERVVPRVVDPLGAELLVLGNLSRDQLDRFGEVHAVSRLWRRVAEEHPDLHVVANASDPHVVWAATPARTTWVDVGIRWRSDAATCPSCGALLAWSADRFDCPSCGFGQPEAAARLDGDALVLDTTRVPLVLALPGEWNRANAALAVVAATTHFGVAAAAAAAAAATVRDVAGRFMAVPLGDGRRATVVLAKNPAGWSEALRLAASERRPTVVAVNARVADGRDPSWLWDVPYELLDGLPVAAAGDRRLDVAVRLRYAGLRPREDVDPVAAAAALPGDEPLIIASYTQLSALYRRFG